VDFITPISLFIIGAISAFIGTNTGGGALITTGALILFGLPPQAAIATAKLGSVGTMLSGWYRFHLGDKVIYRIGLPVAICAGLGAAIGATTLVHIPSHLIERLLGVGMLIILVVMLMKGIGLGVRIRVPRWAHWLGYALFFIAGLWGGLLPGQGILSTYILLFCFGQSMLQAAGTRKIAGLTIAIVALIFYSHFGLVHWWLGLVLLAGALLGSYLGAAYGLKRGDRFVRQLFMVVVALLAGRLLFV